MRGILTVNEVRALEFGLEPLDKEDAGEGRRLYR